LFSSSGSRGIAGVGFFKALTASTGTTPISVPAHIVITGHVNRLDRETMWDLEIFGSEALFEGTIEELMNIVREVII
jgi:hypothetical protein